jgi:uroporphyrinogen-III synthase
MHFLLTRPEEDSKKLADRLKALGHEVTCRPLLTIEPLPAPEIDLDNFQAVLFTSANGVRAFAQKCPYREITCFSVGDATAATAKDAGFSTIYTAGGDVDKLAELIIHTLDKTAQPLLHISGTAVAGNLSERLTKTGFQVHQHKLYTARKATRFSAATQALIQSGHITHMPFYSPRTAKTFVDIIQQEHLSAHLSKITALCLSSAVSNVINSHVWHGVLTAAQPDQHSLFALIDVKPEEDRQ